jgi:hypothetical protein
LAGGINSYAYANGSHLKYTDSKPISATSSSITLEDRLDHVDPNVLNGWFSVWGAGASFGPGYGASSIQLGGNGRILARPKDSGAWSHPSFGSQNGLELGAGGTVGRSMLSRRLGRLAVVQGNEG